ncbi:MAG: PAS domain-containing protein, partial [Blastocatellia bacterium]|nr:PAS domain-containing protein [Blastocatellia bacterium]
NADYKNLKVLYVSPAYEEIWGQSCDTLYQNPWSWIEAIHPEDKAVLEIVDPTTTEKTNNQYRIVRPDGSIRWVMSRRYPIKEASGKVYRWARVVTDITEQKKFEAALQESEIRFKQLAENISDIFFIIDPLTLKWLYVSPAYEKIWGQKIEELEENFWKWFDLIHTNDALKTKEHANRYIVEWQPNSLSYEYRIMRPDGVRWLMTRTYPIKNSDGEVYRIAGITTDITEQKNTEEWMQNIIREKETLIQEIHHRVKNNLSIISGLFELQLDSINDQQIRLFLIDCQNRIDMMASIHERLYKAEDLSSIYLPEHISDMVSHILDIYSIDQSKIEVTIDIDNIFVEINQAIPFSIIINELVTNSLKHAFPQKTCGKISITSVTKDDYHCFIISDTGIGIAAGFDLEKTESLGLKLVYLLAKQLKGSIVHCQNLIGTVFRLTFPILSNR